MRNGSGRATFFFLEANALVAVFPCSKLSGLLFGGAPDPGTDKERCMTLEGGLGEPERTESPKDLTDTHLMRSRLPLPAPGI